MIKSANILKIVDIESTQLFPEFITWLTSEIDPTYRDSELKEHIYNHENIIENQEDAETSIAPMFESQLTEIGKLIRKHKAAYFRIIY